MPKLTKDKDFMKMCRSMCKYTLIDNDMSCLKYPMKILLGNRRTRALSKFIKHGGFYSKKITSKNIRVFFEAIGCEWWLRKIDTVRDVDRLCADSIKATRVLTGNRHTQKLINVIKTTKSKQLRRRAILQLVAFNAITDLFTSVNVYGPIPVALYSSRYKNYQ